jgi:hypothetical protein
MDTVTSRDDGLAELAEDIGKALLRFADRLRGSEPTSAASAPAAATPRRGLEERLGAAQRAVLEAVRAAGDGGATSTDVAKAANRSSSNTPAVLRTLASHGLVRSVGERPTVWVAQ